MDPFFRHHFLHEHVPPADAVSRVNGDSKGLTAIEM